VLDGLATSSLTEFAEFALRLGGPMAVFGLLFIPSDNRLDVEGEVPGLPGLRYAWNQDETTLRLAYGAADGTRHDFTAELNEDGLFRDERGRAVGRALPGGGVVIDAAAVSADLAQRDEPNLCPAPGPDKQGRGAAGEKDRDYEDYVKLLVNPDNPTPRGWGVQLPNPADNGKLVFYDDCQRTTGMMVEAKGTGYDALLAKNFLQFNKSLAGEWLDQSGRQIQASAGRPIRWYFAEPAAAEFARDIFSKAREGRESIEIAVAPW
jgi:hypothetical protein